MAKNWFSLRPNQIIKKAKDKGFKDFEEIYMKTTIRLMPEPASIIGDLNWNGGKDPWMIKVNQQYARMTVHNTVKEMGFQVEEEWEMEDNTIELTVTRWVQ